MRCALHGRAKDRRKKVGYLRGEGRTVLRDSMQESDIEDGAVPSLDVCLASPLFHPEYSGGAARFRGYAPGLRVRGIRMQVLAASLGTWKAYRTFTRTSGTAGEGPQAESEPSVLRVPLPERKGPWQATSIGRNMAMLRSKWIFESAVLARCRDPFTRPDLVIWRYPLALTSIRALRSLRRMGIPMMRVVTMYGGPGGSGWRTRVKELLFPVPFGYLDCVVVSSDVMLENLRELGVKTRIEVISHGVDLTRFFPHPGGAAHAPVRRRLQLAPKDEIVLFVGPISRRKGVDILASAWQRVAVARPRAHLVLVGPEPSGTAHGDAEPFSRTVKEALQRGPGSDRVRFTGPVSDVEEYMRAADLFVFPSRREGMPNVVLEAFASAVPCILGPFRGLSGDFGLPGQHFVLVEHDQKRLASEICELLDFPARRRDLGRAAHRWAKDHLDLEQSLDRLAGVCRELAAVGGTCHDARFPARSATGGT
jgi:glycosyltransferase involved in cell wall biosynthesis